MFNRLKKEKIDPAMKCIWIMKFNPTTCDLNKWVSYLNENFIADTQVDWCYKMGRAHIYAMGDLKLISEAMLYYLPHLNNMIKKQVA